MTMTQSHLESSQTNRIDGLTLVKVESEVRCGMCGRIIYVKEETLNFVSEAISAGLDNPFRCEHCEEEYDDLVYDG